MARICLVSCASLKANGKKKASELYLSPLFRGAKAFANDNFDRWYILSAKHGLVDPNSVIEPYDKTLNRMTSQERGLWAKKVYEQLVRCTKPDDEITFLAGLYYRKSLATLLSERGHKVLVPMERMSIGKQIKWLKEQNRTPTRKIHIEEFYNILKELERALGSKRVLGECNGKMKWPKRGVYFFFEPSEFRFNRANDLRVVRVGTHMVSKGSKATFWHRLHTHRGTETEGGNHRASIFRLHVGEAIMRKSNGKISIPTWGKVQVASTEVRKQEESLEREVSKYIRKLSLLWLEVPDKSGPVSDRAYIEKNSIGLLSCMKNPFDSPGNNWLGNFSPNSIIRLSGLWNVNYVDYPYDARFPNVLRNYVDAAIGRVPLPQSSIAPKDWYLADKGKNSRGQMFLFGDL